MINYYNTRRQLFLATPTQTRYLHSYIDLKRYFTPISIDRDNLCQKSIRDEWSPDVQQEKLDEKYKKGESEYRRRFR